MLFAQGSITANEMRKVRVIEFVRNAAKVSLEKPPASLAPNEIQVEKT
jgi:hypothetical protein